jgi:GntR family transcriptional regulator/MocR family aminotransferase
VSRSNSDVFEQTNRADADADADSDPGFPLDILLKLDRTERRGLREQLQQHLRSAIQQGRLPAGTLLPPSRTLARDLGVARSVVVDTYEHLAADGYLESRQGSGTRVLPTANPVAAQPATSRQPEPVVRFIGGLPDPEFFPRAEWLRHYRAAINSLPNRSLGYPGPLGAAPLREALTSYVARVRGVAATPDQVMITAGLTQGVVLLCRALRARGVEAIAVEDPCFGFHRQAISNAGLRAVPIPVDGDGLDVARLPDLRAGHRTDHRVGAVLVAPAHSYPTGAVLSPARRAALVEWAQHNDALVIEDDYDAEFRYDRAPIGALQGLAPDRVAYAGCASKMLTPALRLGWIMLPRALVDDVVREKLFDDMGSTLLEQLALARFIETGGLTKHLRRVRPIYRRRRDATLEALAVSLPDAIPTGVAAGLHVYVQLPGTCDEVSLTEAARTEGLLIEGAGWHWADPESAPPALVLGYGSIGESAIRTGLQLLGSIYRGWTASTSVV